MVPISALHVNTLVPKSEKDFASRKSRENHEKLGAANQKSIGSDWQAISSNVFIDESHFSTICQSKWLFHTYRENINALYINPLLIGILAGNEFHQ
jgi:hypothetical protein